MRVLVVDDEELIIEFLERSLKLDKHIVEVARNGMDAFEKASNNAYDAIVLDVVMPIKTGMEVCKELRDNKVNTPILLLTSNGDEASKIAGLDCGADDYLTKPFSYKELEARLRALARRPLPIVPEVVTVGGLSLNPTKKVISLQEQPLELRPKEYALLEHLMRNEGKVISKEDLLKNVWLISANNASNRLEVCMYHIRSKINVQHKFLKTIRGYGYVIESEAQNV